MYAGQLTTRARSSQTKASTAHALWWAPICLERTRGIRIGADGEVHSREETGGDGGSDADQTDRLARRVGVAKQALDAGIDRAFGPLDGEAGEILGGSEAAGNDHGVEFLGARVGDVPDLPTGDAGRLGEHVARLAFHRLAGAVIDDIPLRLVGGQTLHLGARTIEGQQGDHALMDLGPVEISAPRQHHGDTRHFDSSHRSQCSGSQYTPCRNVFELRRLGSALPSHSAEDGAGDGLELDLVGASADLEHLRVAHQLLDGKLRHVAGASVDLDRIQ